MFFIILLYIHVNRRGKMNKSMPHHHHYTHIQPTSQLNFNFAKREQQLIYINLKCTIVSMFAAVACRCYWWCVECFWTEEKVLLQFNVLDGFMRRVVNLIFFSFLFSNEHRIKHFLVMFWYFFIKFASLYEFDNMK